MCCWCVQREDDDPCASRRREADHLTEIAIERDDRAPFLGADLEQRLVRYASKSLIEYRGYVVSGGCEQRRATSPNVLIEFDLQPGLADGNGQDTLARSLRA